MRPMAERKIMKRNNKKKLLASVLFFSVIIFFVVIPYKQIYLELINDLTYKKVPAKNLDAIFTLSFEPERLEQSLAWKKQTPSIQWILSIGRSHDSVTQKYKQLDLDFFLKKNVPFSRKDIFDIDSSCRHTYEEARLLDKIVARNGFRNILIVSAPYHMKRVKYIFERLKNNSANYYYDYPDWSMYTNSVHTGYLFDSYHRRIWTDPLSMHPFLYCWKFLLKELIKNIIYRVVFN
jgi:uncharacterized SAM-binding protein YcdF (DUF218 family)